MINYPVWFAGSLLFIAGIIGLLLTHFGIVAGFLWITPIIWGVGAMAYWGALPVPHPAWSFAIVWGITFVLALEILYYGWLGLNGVI